MAVYSRRAPAGGVESPRWIVFVHQDGVLLCTTLRALDEVGLLRPSLDAELSVAELVPDITRSGFGSLRVALRCLASQGWLAEAPALDAGTTRVRWTDAGRAALRHRDLYVAAGALLARFSASGVDAWSRPWTAEQIDAVGDLVPLTAAGWNLDRDLPDDLRALVATHLDAALAVPVMLSLRERGLLEPEGPVLPEGEMGDTIGSALDALGLVAGGGAWSERGRETARLTVHFGMAASYLPLLARLPQVCRGAVIVGPLPGGGEWHVQRGLNVRASAAAHARYFADADGTIAEIFDREPVSDQPRFIADVGCGDGSWLVRLHRLVAERTLRGRCLDAYPLLMVAIDVNPAALERAQRELGAAGVPALLVQGDVSDPDGLRSALAEHALAIEDGLHVRAFVDHNRTYEGGDAHADVPGWSSGAYVDDSGEPLDAAAVERDLVAHLRRWAPHVHRHGLIVLEAHCVAPEVARRHLGATHAVAFDAYHGYSHQYPVEHAAFVACLRAAGLRRVSHRERRYPAERPFTAVSLNRIVVDEAELPGIDPGVRRDDGWQPDRSFDLADGRALHELLYAGGDLFQPRAWCSAATGQVVAAALEAVEERLGRSRGGDTIRVLDYGAGTGLATIEFLKACRERGLERRLEQARIGLEVHLVDLPSGWFAQGFALLRDCAWTRFHSLRGDGGGFRRLADAAAGVSFDAVMSNMVFHLIAPGALDRVAADLAAVVHPGGSLAWSAPDLGPPGRYAVLFHDPNRTLRARWLELLRTDPAGAAPVVRAAVERARRLDADARRSAQQRADRRVLPRPNHADDVTSAIARHFTGGASVELPTYELLAADVVDTLLVPSNQREYLAEIEDDELRADVVRELMSVDVLPELQQGPAGTGLGLNVQWTVGTAKKAEG